MNVLICLASKQTYALIQNYKKSLRRNLIERIIERKEKGLKIKKRRKIMMLKESVEKLLKIRIRIKKMIKKTIKRNTMITMITITKIIEEVAEEEIIKIKFMSERMIIKKRKDLLLVSLTKNKNKVVDNIMEKIKEERDNKDSNSNINKKESIKVKKKK